MALATGTTAPDFTLKTKNDEGLADVTLSDNFDKKKTVLLFFPLAFTSVCMKEMCDVSDSITAYNDLNAAVYGISVDSPFAQEQMAKVDGLKFPLLSDFNKEVSTAYDVCYADLLGFKGVSKRSAFVIDEKGVIIYSESSEDPHDLPNFDAIKAALA
ncbi:redoxin domain-containing protein [Coraliomargarita sp. SDUM461003]|uniref:Redoxin domain-containing protein n=1 Tax=Thalassobacterium maritimum TaxID=3041265 RepID=A0ABU1AUJ6_9BACT|nr:redoxin domain-containing protein [Coraliomargarita sp. SDUM461003]MBT65052.1 peroxiredoxin [Puniceicoccaceae bacterium]MDQ8207753.1 redoxin domain-containing protein [Coraliomargarita sp. SDUM461003]|tara:strand:+ start:15805 stop:16275 length:471 start_codon:yes stop_codon:yes gene_type:complete